MSSVLCKYWVFTVNTNTPRPANILFYSGIELMIIKFEMLRSVGTPQCCLIHNDYGAETLTLTEEAVYRMRDAQRVMEHAMLGIKLIDRVLIYIIQVGI